LEVAKEADALKTFALKVEALKTVAKIKHDEALKKEASKASALKTEVSKTEQSKPEGKKAEAVSDSGASCLWCMPGDSKTQTDRQEAALEALVLRKQFQSQVVQTLHWYPRVSQHGNF
jgi:hypothetical protein